MLIHERIQLILKANGLSASEFAAQIGVKRSNLSHVLSGRNKPSLDFLSKIITAFPNVNASWLITGETREGEFKGEEKNTETEVNPTVNQKVSTGTVEVTREVEKIVVFYANGTFTSYQPNEK